MALLLATTPALGALTADVTPHGSNLHQAVDDRGFDFTTGSPQSASGSSPAQPSTIGFLSRAVNGFYDVLFDRSPTSTVRDDGTGVLVSFPKSDFDSANVTIASYPTDGDHHLPSASPTVRISTKFQPPGTPTVSLPLSDSVKASDADHLAVYRWDGSASGWRRVETTIDEGSRRANATVSSLGFFTVLNETAWNESTRVRRPDTIAPENPSGVYVGTENGTLGKVEPDSGDVVWARSLDAAGKTAVAADPEGAIYAAVNDSPAVSQFDWVDGSRSRQVGFERHIHSLTTARAGTVIAAATGQKGGNVTLVDADRGYRPWTLIHFSKYAADYNLDAITEGADGGIYAGLYFESRREPTRLVRLNRTALKTPTKDGENDSSLTRWETRLDARYINDLQQRDHSLLVATSRGVRSVHTDTGATRWSTIIDDGVSGLAVGPNGTIYAARPTDQETKPVLLQLDPRTGSIRNRTTLPLNTHATITDLTVGTDGTVYVGSQTDAVYDPNASQGSAGVGSGTVPTVGNSSGDDTRQQDRTNTTPTITVSRSEPNGPTSISIRATQQHISTDEDLTLAFSADAKTSATIQIETTSGQVLFTKSLTASTRTRQFSISGFQPGQYVATIETQSGSLSDRTETITVSESGQTGATRVSIQATESALTVGENLTLQYSAEASTAATITLESGAGTTVMEQSVTATETPKRLTVPELPAGEYVAVVETEDGTLSDRTATVTVEKSGSDGPTTISVRAVDRTITTEDDLRLRFSADQQTPATLRLETPGGSVLLEKSVTARTQTRELSIPDLNAGSYVATIETDSGDCSDHTGTITVDEPGQDGPTTISIQAPQRRISTGENLTLNYSADAETSATITVKTTDGQVLLTESVTAITRTQQFSVSSLQAGKYVAAIETDAGTLNDTTETITVTDSTSTDPTGLSVQAVDRNISTGEDLVLQFVADQQTSATLRVKTTGGTVLVEQGVTAGTQSKRLSVPDLNAGTYVATITATSGDASDSTSTITVSNDDGTDSAGLSFQAVERNVTTDEELVLQYSASQQTEARLTIRTTDGQTVLEKAVTASDQPTRLSIPNLNAGEYVGVLEAMSVDGQATTGTITVTRPEGPAPTELSIRAVQTEFTTEENLTLAFSADALASGQLRVETGRGRTVVNTSVSVKEQPTRLMIPNLSAGEYVAILTVQKGNLTARTEPITIESVSDPTLNVSAPPNEFARSEPLALQLETNAQRNVTFDVRTMDGESVHNGTVSHPGGNMTFRLRSIPAGTYVVTVRAADANLTARTDPVTIRVVDPQVSAGPSIVRPGEAITFTAATNDSGRSESIVETIWEFGDGTTETVQGAQVSHAYDEPGEYEVRVTIVDSFGGGEEYTVTKRVSVGSESDFTESKGTVTAISPNGSVAWQRETDAGVTDLAETTGVAPDRNPEGETTPIWSIDVPADNRTKISAAVRVTGDANASGELVAYDGETINRASFSSTTWTTVRLPVTEFAGEEITVSIDSSEGAQAEVTDVRLLRHDDGDRLPNYIENATYRLPIGRGTEFSLDPTRNDTDGDGVPDHWEVNFRSANCSARSKMVKVMGVHSNPLRTDTDGDGLTDNQEQMYPWLSPFLADTDGDGIRDPHEDKDNDQLSVMNEISNGTSPIRKDTDGDGLSDYQEIAIYKTDPLDPDSDNDGIKDGIELEIGINPVKSDSDGDGIRDGNESYKITKEVENTSAQVSVKGPATVATQIRVKKVPQNNSDKFRRSAVIHVTNRSDFNKGEISFEVPKSISDTAKSNLSIIQWSPQTDNRWHLVNTTIENETASTTVDHFSYFALVRADLWLDKTLIKKPSPGSGSIEKSDPVDVSLVLDTSGSMQGHKISDAKEASKALVDSLDNEDQVAIVGFDSAATLHQLMTTDHSAVTTAISNLHAAGGTRIGAGIKTARQQHTSNGNNTHEQVMILLSDGHAPSEQTIKESKKAANDGITIHTVAVGSGADVHLLRKIAEKTGGDFISVHDSTDLKNVFTEISDDINYADHDEDGLYDITEKNGIWLPVGPDMGKTVTTNPNKRDTDGDGLWDGQEVTLAHALGELDDEEACFVGPDDAADGAWIAIATSNPEKANSDGVGLNDKRELKKGTNPLKNERLLLSFEIATITTKDGEIKNFGGNEGDREALIAGEYEWGSKSCLVGSLWCNHKPPKWLKDNVNTDELKEGKTYYRVPIVIRKKVQGQVSDPVDSVSIKLNPFLDGRVVNGDDIKINDKGTNVTMVVESDDESSLTNPRTRTFGKFEIKTDIPADHPFARSGTGRNEQISVETETYGYPSFCLPVAARAAGEVIQKWKKATITLYSTAYGGIYGIEPQGSIAKKIAYKAIEKGKGEIIDNIKEGTSNGNIHLQKYEGKVHTHKVDVGPYESKTRYYVFLGVAIVREN